MTAFQGPPRSCPHCLVGACHRCTGWLTVLDAAGSARDERCEHEHPAGRGPVAQVLADVPAADVLGEPR